VQITTIRPVSRDTLDEDDSDTLDGDEQGPLVTIIVSPSSS